MYSRTTLFVAITNCQITCCRLSSSHEIGSAGIADSVTKKRENHREVAEYSNTRAYSETGPQSTRNSHLDAAALPSVPLCFPLCPPLSSRSVPLCLPALSPFVFPLCPPLSSRSVPFVFPLALCLPALSPFVFPLCPPLSSRSVPLCLPALSPFVFPLCPPLSSRSVPLCLPALSPFVFLIFLDFLPNAAEPQPKRASARTTNAPRFAVTDVILSAVHPALRARLSRPLVYVSGCYGRRTSA